MTATHQLSALTGRSNMSLRAGTGQIIAMAQGAGFALAADIAMARLIPHSRTAVAAAALVAAAAVYPLARRQIGIDAAITRLPRTYAAACAGADITIGARLLLA
jgi:hypothetical protein